jgi:hypothetical protein
MARVNHDSGESQNPTEKYLKWKSNDKSFTYWDKTNEKEVTVSLPFKFVFLQHYHTVKGWHDASGSAIYSNEVYQIGKQPMMVRSYKGGDIVSGIYKDIKPKVNQSGGVYHRSIYVMLEDGSLVNLSIKGAVVKEWSDFYDFHKNIVDNKWIEVNEALDQKKGSVKYSTPKFTIGEGLDANTVKAADNAGDRLSLHMERYFANQIEINEPVSLSDDLAF